MVRWYIVGLLKLGRAANAETAENCGSGTLVRIGDVHYILTAAHVAAALPTDSEIGILRFPSNSSAMQRMRLDMALVAPTMVGTNPYSDTGPDLALLRLPDPAVSILRSTNSFFDLGKRREAVLSRELPSRHCFDCVTGVVAERTTDVPVPNGIAQKMRLFEASFEPGTFVELPDHAGCDRLLFTPQIDEGYAPPASYEGVSGAALWRVFCAADEGGRTIVKEPWIWGVAFWQSNTAVDGSRTIVCHGPKSVYEQLFAPLNRNP